MKNIYLIGFMGTGKSVVAKRLARKLKWRFVDLDELIEAKEKRSIVDIFAHKGEPYFRKVERSVLKEVAKKKKRVVSCGGGIVLNEKNIRLMKKAGIVVCLSATPAVILKRVSGQTHRPLLNVPNPKEKISVLLKSRAPYYAQADRIIDTSKLSVIEVVNTIARSLH